MTQCSGKDRPMTQDSGNNRPMTQCSGKDKPMMQDSGKDRPLMRHAVQLKRSIFVALKCLDKKKITSEKLNITI